MFKFSNLKIRNKLRILSLFSILSLIVLGFISNYFYNTGKTLSIIINAERVHNNTFQEGIEYFYKYQIDNDSKWLEEATTAIETANKMAYDFGTIDQLMQLPKKEYIEVLYNNYKEAYNYERNNANLMASRIKLLLLLKSAKLIEAQKISYKGYELGQRIKNRILDFQNTTSTDKYEELNTDLMQMRTFYADFAFAISSLNTFANNLLFLGISLIVILLIITVIFISILISKSITIPVYEMVNNFGIIAKGNLETELSIDTSNEIGELANSFRKIQNGLLEVIEYTKKVAAGDYSSQIQPRSNEDELSIALNRMVEQLKKSHKKSQQDSWFKSGINHLNKKLSGNQKPEEISANALSFLMEFLEAQGGSIHHFEEGHQTLKLLSYAGFDSKKIKTRVKLNEGITGQVAFNRQMVSLSNIPDESYNSFSSSGEFIPKEIVVFPLLFNELLVGVLEIASIQHFSKLKILFIKQACEIIAINLNSAESTLKTNELLKKTQDQANELQVQQEELRVANEELVEHTKVLTENEKKLQVQQEELRVANEELEERTRQLEIQKEDISNKNQELTETHAKLEIKAKELQLASQYKSEFLANMSHELRTPLNSLLILSNLLSKNSKGNLTEEQVQSAKIIHKSGTDLLHLINEVLDLSKIEAGKMSLEFEQFNTVDLKNEILMNFKAMAEDKNLKFEVEMDDNFPHQLISDRYRLMQILKNLLSNAFKFTTKGEIAVNFIATPPNIVFQNSELNTISSCCIKVSDTGVGIPEEKLEAIFEAFQQADGSISRKFGGTGLGLSISRELIRMLGGEIQLKSQINKGSSFYVFLPKNTKKTPTNSFINEEHRENTESKTVTEETIVNEKKELPAFIADDRNGTQNDRLVLIIHPSKQQAKKFLQQARSKNFRAIVARDISEGIKLAEKYSPKAIMLAVELTNSKNGAYQQLKTNKITSQLPVHLISATIDYNKKEEQSELKTLESVEFTDALESLEEQSTTSVKKILLVGDDQITRKIITELLSNLNIEITETQLAEEAFKSLSNETFDCIILDLGLPDYSGKELLEKLKTNNIRIPKVIVYTGKEMSDEEIKILNSYTDTIILKGIKSDERLMDEVTLFLHQVSKRIPEKETEQKIVLDNDNLFKGKKILIVDDEIRNVFSLGKVLEEKNIDVLEAENGQVALDILKREKGIDLVLMDVMMPVMDGYEAIRIIRKTPAIKDIPIICLTAKAMKEDYENAIKNGANDYLSKPLNEEKLFSMLKIWLYKN